MDTRAHGALAHLQAHCCHALPSALRAVHVHALRFDGWHQGKFHSSWTSEQQRRLSLLVCLHLLPLCAFDFAKVGGRLVVGATDPVSCLQDFTALGLLSGAMFVAAIGCSFLAVQLLDSVAVATGIWCGVAMVASFCFGVLSGDHVSDVALATLALVLMVTSIVGITLVYLRLGYDHCQDWPVVYLEARPEL
jgi:multidrug transporter EmrE-like cation transporter